MPGLLLHLFILLAAAAAIARESKARATQRFDFSFSGDASAGVFNPAATWTSEHGWVFTFRRDLCFYQQCGIHHTNTTLLVAELERDYTLELLQDLPAASMTEVAAKTQQWEFEEASFKRLLQTQRAALFTAGDFRPFVYKGQVHVTHWVKLGWDVVTPLPANADCFSQGWGDLHSCSHMAISRLNFDSRQLVLVYFFGKALDISARQRDEKNWAMVRHGEGLRILYTVSPCTQVFRYDPFYPTGAFHEFSWCYNNTAQELVYNVSGMDMGHTHLSGHPVEWRHQNGTTELLAMVHQRVRLEGGQHGADYRHWLLRLQPQSLQVLHVSAAPVLQSSDYHLEGFFPGVLAVGSFHLLPVNNSLMLRVLFGESDQFSCWDDLPMDGVEWLQLDHSWAERTDRLEDVSAFMKKSSPAHTRHLHQKSAARHAWTQRELRQFRLLKRPGPLVKRLKSATGFTEGQKR